MKLMGRSIFLLRSLGSFVCASVYRYTRSYCIYSAREDAGTHNKNQKKKKKKLRFDVGASSRSGAVIDYQSDSCPLWSSGLTSAPSY